jgi:hypothetical protein
VFRKPVGAQSISLLVDHKVLLLDETLPPQFFEERHLIRRAARTTLHAAEPINPTLLLRPR